MPTLDQIMSLVNAGAAVVCTGLVVYIVVWCWPEKDKAAKDERTEIANAASEDRKAFRETLKLIVQENREAMHEVSESLDALKDEIMRGGACRHGNSGG